MLSIHSIGSSGAQVGYYANLGQEDYYLKGGEPPGKWLGRGAEHFGLSGTVSGQDLRNMLRGLGRDGRKLVQNAGGQNRRAGFDLTWSVPKSVSTALSQANEDQAKLIEQAAERAVRKAFEVVEELCGQSRRGKRGLTTERSQLVAAIFRHDTSRAVPGQTPDPNLHFHLVLANLSLRPDGTTGALDARKLFKPQMKMALGALFRAELSKNLEEIGLASHRPKNDRDKEVSWFELNGVPESLNREFSKRRQQIEDWLHRTGRSGAKASEQATLATRQSKEALTRDQLRSSWQRTGALHGFSSGQLELLLKQPTPRRDPGKELDRAMVRALKLITEERARFSEIEFLRFVAQEAQTHGLGITQIRSQVRHAVSHWDTIVRLRDADGLRQFTTREMLAVERRMLARASRAVGDARHQISLNRSNEIIARFHTLKPEQSVAIRYLVSGNNAIACVNGMAGTGKTFLLGVAKQIWTAERFTVIGTALAAKAAQTLEEGSGIPSVHLHKLLHELSTGRRRLDECSIVVLDEAGMVGTRMMDKLMGKVEAAGAKLVMVGDHRQLQAISAGAPFRVISEKTGVVELRDITRQREPWARNVVRELASGKAQTALEQLAARGQLTIAATRVESIKQLVQDWHVCFAAGSDSRVFAGTRLETRLINQHCQQQRLQSDELAGEALLIGHHSFYVGDRIVVTKNAAGGLLKNGMTGTVTEIDAGNGVLRLKIDGGLHLRIDTQAFEHFDLGYCTTTHKGQGQTVDNAFILTGGSMTDRELSYVQGSRARETTAFYADVETGGASIEQLAAQMSRSRQKDLAHEHLIEGA